MAYYTQPIIAQILLDCGIKVIVREGLNERKHWELRLEIPSHLHDLWTRDTFVYTQEEWAYFAEDETTGRVRFFCYDKPGDGFGGHTYPLKMRDGSIKELKGPWSSNSHAMNVIGFTPSMPVNIKAMHNMADHMSLEAVNKLLKPLDMEAVLIEDEAWIIRL